MSKWEDVFADVWTHYGDGTEPERQYRFLSNRRFRADFAFVEEKVLIEIDGFGFGHQSIASLTKDHERQNLAILAGWVLLRFTPKMLGTEEKRIEAVAQVKLLLHKRRKGVL